jgi:hypothetical protein
MPTLNQNQVSSPGVLDVLLGVPQSHLLIFTGIAIPEFSTDDDLIREQVIVPLGRTVSNPLIPFQYSAEVGLASIGNADSDYTFATDDVKVIADPQTGELQLVCDIAVQGSSKLHRFSYQANVIVETKEPAISGKIIWKNSTASAQPQFANDLFSVQASIFIPPPPGVFGGSYEKVADGTVIYPPVQTPGGFFVDYVIENPPLNTDLFIFCTPVDGAFLAAPGTLSGSFSCDQTSGPSPVNLAVPNLQVGGVDFLLTIVSPPR